MAGRNLVDALRGHLIHVPALKHDNPAAEGHKEQEMGSTKVGKESVPLGLPDFFFYNMAATN